jgi:glycosyltransferase involved in cell wall biosynthesis
MGSLTSRETIGQSGLGQESHSAFCLPPRVWSATLQGEVPLRLDIVCGSVGLKEAEETIFETVRSLGRHREAGADLKVSLYLLGKTTQLDSLEAYDGLMVHRLWGMPAPQRFATIASSICGSPSPTAYIHLPTQTEIEQLWSWGVKTIPVFHTTSAGWTCDPRTFQQHHVPFTVAVSQSIRRDLLFHCQLPAHVIPNEIASLPQPDHFDLERTQFRKRFKAMPGQVLIGMIGKIKPQRRYPLAVEVLCCLRKHVDAKLVIVCRTEANESVNGEEYSKLARKIQERGVEHHIVLSEPGKDVATYYPAFDVFLNTSNYEGFSIPTTAARLHGLSTVVTDVDSQRDAKGIHDIVVPPDTGPREFANHILKALTFPRRPPAAKQDPLNLASKHWIWLLHHGFARPGDEARQAVLFLTYNLNQGGAQRSLCNLLTSLNPRTPTFVLSLESPTCEVHLKKLEAASVPHFALSGVRDTSQRADRILAFVETMGIKTICFWHFDAKLKLILARVYKHRGIRLMDVNPGPVSQLFAGLDRWAEPLTPIGSTRTNYLRRLDYCISKYRGGIPEPSELPLEKSIVIPNGVEYVDPTVDGKKPVVRPPTVRREFAVVSCCRIVPHKLLEQQLLTAAALVRRLPSASLTIVGQIGTRRNDDYARRILKLQRELNLRSAVRFVGPNANALTFLREFRALLMLSRMQGCPNASLEAMACGLPIVANPDGGTAEQVVDGITGFLVPAEEPELIAEKLALLLTTPELATKMGNAGRQRARSIFSLEKMAQSYRNVLWPEHMTI